MFSEKSAGNALSKQGQGNPPLTMAYDAASRIVTSMFGAIPTTYTFDANGNTSTELSGGVLTQYSYDNENRQTKIIYSDGRISTYTYRYDGLRFTRQEPGSGVHTTVWDGSDYAGAI